MSWIFLIIGAFIVLEISGVTPFMRSAVGAFTEDENAGKAALVIIGGVMVMCFMVMLASRLNP